MEREIFSMLKTNSTLEDMEKKQQTKSHKKSSYYIKMLNDILDKSESIHTYINQHQFMFQLELETYLQKGSYWKKY